MEELLDFVTCRPPAIQRAPGQVVDIVAYLFLFGTGPRPVPDWNGSNFMRQCYGNMTARCYVGEEVAESVFFEIKIKEYQRDKVKTAFLEGALPWSVT